MVEIGAGESDRGSDGDGVSAAVVGDDFGGGLCDGECGCGMSVVILVAERRDRVWSLIPS